MKKVLYALAMAMTVFASCSNEELVNNNHTPNQFATLTATIEQEPANSRIVISNENSVDWSNGDVIRVFMKNQPTEPTYYDYEYANGSFSPKDNGTPIPDETTNDNVLGVYSLKADDDGEYDGLMDGNKLQSGFVQNTVVVNGDESRAILPMWGTWNDGNISFKHLGGVMRINLTDLPAGYDFLAVIADKPISGNAYVQDVTDTTSDLVLKMQDDYTANGDHNLITVRFANAATRTLYVALPVDTYGSIQVIVSKYDENNGEGQFTDPITLGTYTYKDVKRAHIYNVSPGIPKVNATTPAAVTSALSTNSNQETFILADEIDATVSGAGSIDIPDENEKTTLNFQTAPKTSSEKPLEFKQNADESSGESTSNLNIIMPAGAKDLYATINTPTATTTLNGGTYESLTAKTATNTLIVKAGTTIKNLTIEGGNVVIEDGASVTDITNNSSAVITQVVTSVEGLTEALSKGYSVKLGDDLELSELIKIETPATIDLGGKTIIANCQKAFEIYADATIKNGAITSQQRCVDTRTNVNLTLADLLLQAEIYYSAHGNQQPITIGGSNHGTVVNMDNVQISAGTQGYGIISFVKATLTANNCIINGYSALYAKPGSEQSEFTFDQSILMGTTVTNDVEGNSFSTIAIQTDNVTVNINGGTLSAEGKYSCAISLGTASAPNVSGNTIKVSADAAISAYQNNMLSTSCIDNNTVTLPASCKNLLDSETFGYTENQDGTITIKSAITETE